ncbi:MAG TPA: hypothetical protein VE326_10660 [Candidatus Binatia bacterium]|nr:hypothetical protein [Candidatus Binatia bacterium]
MKRAFSGLAAALVLGIQALIAALPVGGGAVGPACGGTMACCASHVSCEAAAAPRCPSHAGPRGEAPGAPCVRALGCGHALPGITLPGLDPMVFRANVLVMPRPGSAPAASGALSLLESVPPELTPPPPRA